MRDFQTMVIGTGMMGPGIATTLALAGFPTLLVSRTTARAERGISEAIRLMDQLKDNALVSLEQADRGRSLLKGTADLNANLRSSRLVIESIPENLTLKQEFFRQVEEGSNRDTILASNTSGLSITAVAARSRFPERILTTHFWNPPHLMPLVEVVMGNHTSEAVALEMVDILRKCDKTPVLVRKDRPGQLGNRLQHALVREAIHVVQEGIASPEDVDLAVKTGFGLRFPVWGVFEHADAVGLDLVKAIQDYVLADLNNEPQASRLLNEKVASGELGLATGRGFYDWTVRDMKAVKARRDAFLIEFLSKHKMPQSFGSP